MKKNCIPITVLAQILDVVINHHAKSKKRTEAVAEVTRLRLRCSLFFR